MHPGGKRFHLDQAAGNAYIDYNDQHILALNDKKMYF
jgi:hypothetical protein